MEEDQCWRPRPGPLVPVHAEPRPLNPQVLGGACWPKAALVEVFALQKLWQMV